MSPNGLKKAVTVLKLTLWTLFSQSDLKIDKFSRQRYNVVLRIHGNWKYLKNIF